MTPVRSSLAVVLRARAYGESDKIVTFLTKDFGKLTGIGKGAQRSRRRFVNSLDPLARVRVRFRLRPQATLAFLESSELLCTTQWLTEPIKFAYASYVAEVTDQLTAEEHPVAELYELLVDALAALEAGPATSGLLRAFELQLLSRAGYEPQLDRCHGCGQPLAVDGGCFETMDGTFVCRHCRSPDRPVIERAPGLLEHLVRLKRTPLMECRMQSLAPFAAGAAELTGHLLALHLARPLKSTQLIAQLR